VSIRFCLAAALAVAAPAQLCSQTGNGAPNGPHFNLNIIGVAHDKSPNMNGGGNVIFVGLGTRSDAVTTKILLRRPSPSRSQAPTRSGHARSARRVDSPK